MRNQTTLEKTKELLHSYVPEFAYEPEGRDAGSVLTTLCADMIGESERQYEQVVPKHKIQFLNLFDAVKEEPVAASRGYVQFQPVEGYEGKILVPKGTQVTAEISQVGEVIFETVHDMTAVTARPVLMAAADGSNDRIVVQELDPDSPQNQKPFRAFDTQSGENRAVNKVYLCFDRLFDSMNRLELTVHVKASSSAEQEKTLEILASDALRWAVLGEEGTEEPFDLVEIREGELFLVKESFSAEPVMLEQQKGYCLTLTCVKEIPAIYLAELSFSFTGMDLRADEVLLNGIQEPAAGLFPFGKPMGLYNEMSLESREVFSKRGAQITMEFQLSYIQHEEVLEVPELDPEYKTIMKKPQKLAELRPAEVLADYVLWEYLSVTGWKRLFGEEYIATLFNGSGNGKIRLNFVCPEDMAPYSEDNTEGRVRARLIKADNIYKVPALYKCPYLSYLTLSYTYEGREQYADSVLLRNNYQTLEAAGELRGGGSVCPFYQTEKAGTAMYLGFDAPVSGTPLSLYFDVENESDRPVDFTVEYLSDRGFIPVRVLDKTCGFLNAGSMRMMVPGNLKRSSLYGYDGYFLRFLCHSPESSPHVLPLIRGIYMNMAQVENQNVVTEYFYLDELDAPVDIKLSQENLLFARVSVREKDDDGEHWVNWKKEERLSEGGRTYGIDMVEGMIHFRKFIFTDKLLSEEGTQIRVEHSNYTGSRANLPAHSIQVLRNSIRYISAVTNPFPTYGGYDGYTEQTCAALVSGMLRTRRRAVTGRDFFDLIAQTTYGVRRVKCISGRDSFGNPKPGAVTVAVLLEEYAKGAHIFSELKEDIRRRLMENSGILPLGRELILTQPHFVRLNVRLWLEKDSMEQAYELQTQAEELLRGFIDPLNGGVQGRGWEIGEFPRASQILACLRSQLKNCSISRMVMTAIVDGAEVPVQDGFGEQMDNPFLMAVNGEHIVTIELR